MIDFNDRYIIKLETENAELKKQNAELLEVLKELEWSYEGAYDDDLCRYLQFCPICDSEIEDGVHEPNCKLGKLLKEFKQ